MLRTLRLTPDDELAPIIATLDNLDAYFDPRLAPADFVEWLTGWVGVELDETWPIERRRAAVARAVELYSWRGTARGLADQVEIVTGARAEIEDNGGVAWSATPGGPVPGTPQPYLIVKVRVVDPTGVDVRRLDAIVAAAKPAHIPHAVEVLEA